MAVSTMASAKHPSIFGVVLSAVARVVFSTLLFTALGMGVGLLLGIIGTAGWGLLHGGNIDMTRAYRHVAIPFAICLGCTAFLGASYLEIKTRRT
jgi:hypothetical protein